MKARKPARASVIMLSESQARESSLLRFQDSSLTLRSSSTVLIRQSGKVSTSLAQSASTLSSSAERSTSPRFISALPWARASPLLGSPKARRPKSSNRRWVSTSGLATNSPSTLSAGAMSMIMPL